MLRWDRRARILLTRGKANLFVVLTVVVGSPASLLGQRSPRKLARAPERAVRIAGDGDRSAIENADALHPLPPGAAFQKHITTPGGETFSVAAETSTASPSAESSKLVYSNTLGRVVFGPSAGQRVADDILTTAADGCALDKFVFRVSGDEDNNPDIDEGPFIVHYALHPVCPSAKSCEPWNVSCPPLIGGTSGSVMLPNEGLHEVTVVIPPQVCDGGLNDGQACNAPADCLPACVGGPSDGSPCQTFADCPGGECDIVQVGTCSDRVDLPSSFYFAVTFSREQAGIVAGAPPMIGVSADRFDAAYGPACYASFGGFPTAPHANLDLQVFVRGECSDAFAGYHNSMQGGPPYSPGVNRLFADDIRLGVDACNMIAYEARFKGSRSTSQGAVQVALHTSLDPADPETGGRIDRTQMGSQVWNTDVRVLRKTFDPPIPLPPNQELWAVFRTSSDHVGSIKTCKQADVGQTLDTIHQYGPSIPFGTWTPVDLGNTCHSGLDLTIYCDGKPPIGACCDLHLQEDTTCAGGPNDGVICSHDGDCECASGASDCTDGRCIGDTVCREVPQWNCPTTDPQRWREGARCGPVCAGGDNDDESCTSDADCPGGSCDGSFCVGGISDGMACTREADCPGGDCVGGPFLVSCGNGSCCTIDDRCLDATERECVRESPGPARPLYRPGQSCDYTECPFGACLTREGDCSAAHPQRGCADPFCCTPVCDYDPFCCQVAWDGLCVVWTQELCEGTRISNDACYDPEHHLAARLIEVGTSDVVGNLEAWNDPSEPDFCCAGDPSVDGVGKVWYRFIAPDPPAPTDSTVSVEVSTCGSSSFPASSARDSLIQVFAVGESGQGFCADGSPCSVALQDCIDGSTCVLDERAACQNLIPIACNDDAGNTCTGPDGSPEPKHARVCLPALIPGNMYYVMVATKTDHDRGALRVSVSSPCEATQPPRTPNDLCRDATVLLGTDISVPFDLSGGDAYAPVTLDCPGPQCLPEMRNDQWYRWTAPFDGTALIDTCDDRPEMTPDTTLVVYEGCTCPVQDDRALGCSAFVTEPLCFAGSKVQFDAIRDTCYTIRLGGRLSGTPSGALSLYLTGLCGEGEVEFIDPPDGGVDARQPHPPWDADLVQTVDRLHVRAPVGANNPACWSLCEIGRPPHAVPNAITRIHDLHDGTFTLWLDRPLLPGHLAKVQYTDASGGMVETSFTTLPGDVNADGLSDPFDVAALLEVFLGKRTSAWGIYSEDIDHSGAPGPADLLRLIDLLQGAEAFTPGWHGRGVAPDTGACP